MSDIDGGAFSRPLGDVPGEGAVAASAQPETPASPVKKAAAKKAVAKKAVAKKLPAKKVGAVKKAAPTKAVAKKAVAKKLPAKKVGAVKKAAARKTAPSPRKRVGAATSPLGFPPPPPPYVPPDPSPPSPATLPSSSTGAFGFEPPPVTTPTGPGPGSAPPGVKLSRKDRRAARQEVKAPTPPPFPTGLPTITPAAKAKAKAKGAGKQRATIVALLLVLVAAAVAVAVALASQDDGTDYADLRVGDCVRDVSARPVAGEATRRSVTQVEVVDCGKPHETEVFAVTAHPGGKDAPFPGDDAVSQFVGEFCQGPAFEQYVGAARNSSELIDDDIQPSAVSWKAGRRQVICMVADPTGNALTGTVKGSGR